MSTNAPAEAGAARRARRVAGGSAVYGHNAAEDLAYDPEHCARVVAARDVVAAAPARVFEVIADPARQVDWDGNENLAHADAGQRVTAVGEVFRTRLTGDQIRENHVAEFVEGELIAWKPADVGREPAGHLWRWSLAPLADGRTEVTHTYDWSRLADERRRARAESTAARHLAASIARLKALCEATA